MNLVLIEFHEFNNAHKSSEEAESYRGTGHEMVSVVI